MLRLGRIKFQLLAKVAYINAQILSLPGMQQTPHLAQQLAMRQHPAGIGHQRAQQPVFGGREVKFHAAAAYQSGVSVDFGSVEAKHRIELFA